MAIQQNINQLLATAGYFAEPALDTARENQALKGLRKGTAIGEKLEKEGLNIPDTVARDITGAWYGLGKKRFSRDPNEQTFRDYVKAAADAEAAMARWKGTAAGQLQTRQNVEELHQAVLSGEPPIIQDPTQPNYNIPTDPAAILNPNKNKTGGTN